MNRAREAIGNYELFDEITWHLLEDEKPSDYINKLAEQDRFREYPFSMLLKLKHTEQEPKYHPEGNVWEHTMLVLEEAARVREQSREPKVFLWAALLHDIGKPDTTKLRRGRLTSYDHDKAGEKLSVEFLKQVTGDQDFIRSVSALVRYHMHILYVLKKLPYADLKGLLRSVETEEIALLCLCDRLGRGNRLGPGGVDAAAEYRHYEAFLIALRKEQDLQPVS